MSVPFESISATWFRPFPSILVKLPPTMMVPPAPGAIALTVPFAAGAHDVGFPEALNAARFETARVLPL